jgi:hypothetical protein
VRIEQHSVEFRALLDGAASVVVDRLDAESALPGEGD